MSTATAGANPSSANIWPTTRTCASRWRPRWAGGGQDPANFTLDSFRRWTDRSRRNLRVDTLDLVQLHCPPAALYSNSQVFDDLDALVSDGAIAHYGVSVETWTRRSPRLRVRGVASVQIILNAFRLKPLDAVLPAAVAAGVGIIARVPLASGLLTGKYTEDTVFAANDHRTFNRDGSAFDVGETFSGVDFATGVAAAREFATLAAEQPTTAQLSTSQAALAWIAQLDGVSTVIPGARTAGQARGNALAGSAPEFGAGFTKAVSDLYDRYFRQVIHQRW